MLGASTRGASYRCWFWASGFRACSRSTRRLVIDSGEEEEEGSLNEEKVEEKVEEKEGMLAGGRYFLMRGNRMRASGRDWEAVLFLLGRSR